MPTLVLDPPQVSSLADRLREAPLPAQVAIRHALQLADALRRAHDQHLVSGVIDPERIVFSAGAVEMQEGRSPEAYVAPEVLAGRAADERSDIFAFGCVLFRMLAGRDAFPGGAVAPESASEAGLEPELPATVLDAHGPVRLDRIEGLGRLLRHCLARDPEQRLQRMQKVYLELKLLRVGARRPDASVAAARRDRADAALRGEIGRVERNLAFRMEACERALAETREAQDSLRTSAASIEQGVAALRDSVARLDTGLEETVRTTGCVEEALSAQLNAIEDQLHKQGDSVEVLRTTMTQTDDLLERVVEAFDNLQSYVTELSEDRGSGPHA